VQRWQPWVEIHVWQGKRLLPPYFEEGSERRPFMPGAKHAAVPLTGEAARRRTGARGPARYERELLEDAKCGAGRRSAVAGRDGLGYPAATAMSTAPASIRPLARLRTYASFVRFEHTLFTLPLILAGIFSAPRPAMGAGRWLLIALAAAAARTTAISLNRLIDQRLDALNPRTRARELPSGKMKPAEAWSLLAGALVACLAACWALDPAGLFYLKVAAIPIVIFALYPYAKRFTPFCHLGVGLGIGLAPVAGYAAAHPGLAHPWVALWLGAFTFFWGSGFDIIYSTLDEGSDRANGVRSMVVWLGRARALEVSAWLHRAAQLCLIPMVAQVLLAAGQPLPSPAAVVAFFVWFGAGVLLYLEQKWAEDVNLAFFKVNVWVGAAVLALVLLTRAAGGGF
jgi:4-hydroxybenzoate polyprenyltransferase